MGKISAEAKEIFTKKIKSYKNKIEELRKKELIYNDRIKKTKINKRGLLYIKVSEIDLNIVSYLVIMNQLSITMLGIKNEAYLNEGRKTCYKALISLEAAVSNRVDVPFSDYEDMLKEIEAYNIAQRWFLVRKLNFTIQLVKDGFGDNTKWKWSFVELEGRSSVVTKNMINLKTLTAGLDPRDEFYKERYAHLMLAKRLLETAADGYREKYEFSTHRIDDFKIAINFLGSLRRLDALVGEPEEANELRKKIEVWKSKMEIDLKRSELQPK